MNESNILPRPTSIDKKTCVACGTLAPVLHNLDGNCPKCGSSWTEDKKRSTIIQVTMPVGITGGAG
tara:strand:+ start:5703 stop:5900 length:198 start_codon:yes stop_codon:yes gene_type:complete